MQNIQKDPLVKIESNGNQAEDFASDQEIRWCPGCGDYAILKAVQKVLAQSSIPKENFVFVSGIGCASRFPYYLSTYGFHTIHGRAPCIATGIKLSNPKLDVWVVTGDGDGLSIGSNHLIHLMRRNINIKVLLFNNQIYGLTKGQFSPTSDTGSKTKSSPYGSIESPINPIKLALASNCSFVARGIDVDSVGLVDILSQAANHQGTSFVEIYQNCHVFNDGAFEHIRDKASRGLNTISLKPGEPLLFGQNKQQGLIIKDGQVTIQNINSDKDLSKITIYQSDLAMAITLASLQDKQFPVPIGVFYKSSRPCLDDVLSNQIDKQMQENKVSITDVLASGHTWVVE